MKWSKSPETSPIWIRPDEQPIEYLYEVQPIPQRPEGLETVMSWSIADWRLKTPKVPERVLYLGALEWIWSPGHSRCDNYYLSYMKDYWLIFLHEYSDGMSPTWEWYPYAAASRVDSDIRAIGFWMVHDLLSADAGMHEVDRYHLVSAQGLLTVGDFAVIGDSIWSEDQSDWDD